MTNNIILVVCLTMSRTIYYCKIYKFKFPYTMSNNNTSYGCWWYSLSFLSLIFFCYRLREEFLVLFGWETDENWWKWKCVVKENFFLGWLFLALFVYYYLTHTHMLRFYMIIWYFSFWCSYFLYSTFVFYRV